jgi:hypothetical protein
MREQINNNKLKNLMTQWEAGRILTGRQEIQLFQELVDSGIAWDLPAAYVKRAYKLAMDGTIKL